MTQQVEFLGFNLQSAPSADYIAIK